MILDSKLHLSLMLRNLEIVEHSKKLECPAISKFLSIQMIWSLLSKISFKGPIIDKFVFKLTLELEKLKITKLSILITRYLIKGSVQKMRGYFFTPKFLHFLLQFFYTNFFTPKNLLFLQHNFCFFTLKILVLFTNLEKDFFGKKWCKKSYTQKMI